MCGRWLLNKPAVWAAGFDEIDALLGHVIHERLGRLQTYLSRG